MTNTARSQELLQLTPGTSVRREISARQGTLLRFAIDKGDLALTTVVYGPTTTKILEHVSEDFESVDVSVPVDASGRYIIELQSREKSDTRRPFELKVEPFVALTPLGRKDSEARQAVATAGVLHSQWTEASLRQAIEQYDKAAVIWTSIGDFGSASQANLKCGEVYFLLSDFQEALERYQNAVTLAAKAADRIAEAKALIWMGRVDTYIGKNDLAQTYVVKALNLLGPIDANSNSITKNVYGQALSTFGEVTYAKGDMLKSSEYLKGAIEFLQGDRKNEARAHLFAGYLAGSIGVREKAVDEISQALALYQATNHKSGEGLALTALGLANSFKAKHDQAIELHNQAIAIFQSIGDRHSEAIALNALGEAYERLSKLPVALLNYEKALQIVHDKGAVDAEAVAAAKVGKVHALMNQFEEALTFYERSLQLSRSAKKIRTEANVLTEIAGVYAVQHRSEDTLQQFSKVLKIYERIKDPRGQALALNAQGNFLLRIGQKENAANSFRRALSLSEKVDDPGILIATLCNVARGERALGHLHDALSVINRSMKIIEELRTNVGSPDLRASYFSGVRKNYELCIQILSDLEREQPGNGFAAEALFVSEKSRARSLVDLIRESGAGLRKGAPKELLSRERELRGFIQAQAQYKLEVRKNDRSPSTIAEVNSKIDELTSEYQHVQAELREQNPRALSLSQFEPLTLEQIQNELGKDDLLLEISLADEKSHLWAVTAHSLQIFELPDGKTIEDAATELYKLLTVRQQLDPQTDSAYQSKIENSDKLVLEKASSLGQMLLGQISGQLETKRLIFVSEGALQLVPFAVLSVPKVSGPEQSQVSYKPLLLDHEIVDLPSIATLRAIRAGEKKNRDSTDKIAAVIADPVFTKNDDRLQSSLLSTLIARAAVNENRHETSQRLLENPGSSGPARLTHASEEADAISAMAPRGTTMVAKGFDASRETALSPRLGEYQILHFATHGLLDNEHPELSGIVLTMVDKNGVDQNGVMFLHDIYNMDLSAELTVLSACQTALGKDIKGEGFVGLTHSFISAGSKSVVASLWKVDDRATASLMTDFYQSMLQRGMSPAAALRAAKLKMMQDARWSAPYFWAGFIVQGEYTNHIAVDNNSWRRYAVVLLSLLLISSGVIFFKRRRKFT
ncbi:MAG TPA: CHAT domain-containing tetratricopeptide repeat protein [Pyrinomonadaceae bacterium]